jgi:hypothetical protein
MQLYKKVLILGAILVGVFNPLSIALWSDALVIAINFVTTQLALYSNYTVVVGATLLLLGFVLWNDNRSKKETKRLKKLKTKNTAKAGQFIES